MPLPLPRSVRPMHRPNSRNRSTRHRKHLRSKRSDLATTSLDCPATKAFTQAPDLRKQKQMLEECDKNMCAVHTAWPRLECLSGTTTVMDQRSHHAHTTHTRRTRDTQKDATSFVVSTTINSLSSSFGLIQTVRFDFFDGLCLVSVM